MVKISELPIELSPTSNDIVAMVDVETSGTKKVSFDEFGKAINYTNSISADVNNLLAVDGSNKLNLTAANELISSDPNNTISIGTDNKLFRSQAGAALPENNFYVGDSLSQPVAKTANEARQVLGLPTDYKDISVVRDSGSQVTVQGKCRSEQDDIDLEMSSATPVAVLSPTANTKYNLFFAKVNSTSPTVAFFDTASVPVGYSHYRIICSIPTDSLSSLAEFIYKNNSIDVILWSGSVTSGVVSLSDDMLNYNSISFRTSWVPFSNGDFKGLISTDVIYYISNPSVNIQLGNASTATVTQSIGASFTSSSSLTITSANNLSLISVTGTIYNV